MDLATIIGLAGALLIVLVAILLGGNGMMFLDLPSAMIVLGGSMFVVMSKFGLRQFAGAFKVAARAFLIRGDNPAALTQRIVELANVARKSGILALDEVKIENTFLAEGLKLLIDGLEPETVKETLIKDRALTLERHQWGQRIFTSLADIGPAMGMIGTLVGLVQMLSNMDDPKAIGPAMAIALLTTLYGALLANVICLPIADKLKLRGAEESLTQALIIDGLLSIQAGLNPRVIQAQLGRYLPEGQRA